MNLITRSDFDGLTCAALLREVEIIERITFAHPRDVQDRTLEVNQSDILTNLPYHPECGMWFDHHSSEEERSDVPASFEGRFEVAPSAARVVHNHYRSHRFQRFDYLLAQVDKIDSAQLSVEDVVEPTGWVLLSYIMDPRTGLGRYHDYGISNRDLMHRMIDLISTHTADEILAMHDIRQRVRRYFEQEDEFKAMLLKHSRREGNVVITDTRSIAEVPTGNRFLIYTLFPEANISVRVMDGRDYMNTVITIGHSIFNRSARTNVGDLCAQYGGGGHRKVGTIQVEADFAEDTIAAALEQIRKDG
jgi:hypothetical protein